MKQNCPTHGETPCKCIVEPQKKAVSEFSDLVIQPNTVTLRAINIKTGDVVELGTDWMFDDRYGYFVLENKNDWSFEAV